MLGQKLIQENLARYTITNFPKTIWLVGEIGCGKKTLVSDISNKLSLDVITISSNISAEDLISYQQSPVSKIYLIDLDNFTQKQQNQFLKFIEEPSKTVYAILTSSSEAQVLETIKNRCLKFTFQDYSIRELEQIKNFEDKEIYEICNTPGQLENVNQQAFQSLLQFCDLIIEKISSATFANTISISTKINYKEEYDKYDFYFFFKTLIYTLKKKYLKTKEKRYLDEYLFINSYFKDAQIKTINKENFVLNFLIEYKKFINKLL